MKTSDRFTSSRGRRPLLSPSVPTALLALVLLLPWAAACGGGGVASESPEGGGQEGQPEERHDSGVVELSAPKLAAVGVETATVGRRHLAALLQTTGEVGYQEDRIAHVAARVPGRVHRVPVSLGDEVRRGQVLAVLDSVELGQAKARYLAARTREELELRSSERERRLYEDRITSEREMLEAHAAHQEAMSHREAARETLRLYGLSAEAIEGLRPGDTEAALLPVRAPIAGRVVDKHATLGELATPETTLFTIADLDHVWIWIDVYERDLARVHRGDDVTVVVDAYSDREFLGQVTYLSPEVASETRTVRARIDAANPERLLRPGMFATVRLVDPHLDLVDEGTPPLVMPESAVVRRGDRTLVFVPAGDGDGDGDGGGGGRFTARPVVLGRAESGWVEVVDGLAGGEEVVTSGSFFLESELARDELGGGHGH